MALRNRRLPKLIALVGLAACASSSMTATIAAAPSRQEVFFTRLTADTVAVTGGRFVNRSLMVPSTIQPFSESGINGGFADLQKMRDRSGEVVGFGAQLEVWTPDESGRPRPEMRTTWTLVLPGRGTLFLYEIENATRLFQLISAARSGPQPWHGHIDERTTIGPGPGDVGIIVGGTGEFEGRRGTFIETNQFTAFESGGTGAAAPTGVDAAGGAIGSTTITLTYSN